MLMDQSQTTLNNRTLVFLVYYEDEEVGGPVKIDVASIDHAGGAVTWQTLIDTLSPTDLIVWNSSAWCLLTLLVFQEEPTQ